MVIKIGKQYTFDAAHTLDNHKGKCANLHGHTYTVEVSVTGEQIDDDGASNDGMVMDYGDLDDIVKPIIEQLDHSFLSSSYIGARTTAENLAVWIYEQIASLLLFHNITDLSVRVSETPKTYAEYSG